MKVTLDMPNPDWTDTVAVDRFVSGHNPGRPLTPAEKDEALRVMFRRGMETGDACRLLGISGSTYRRVRAEMGGER